MEFTGHVQGAAARKHAGFAYRVPVFTFLSMRQLDPERLTYANEYPRCVNPPSQPDVQIKDVADFKVKIYGAGSDGMCAVQVWLLPNQYTSATTALLICESRAADALRHEYRDEALRRAFRIEHRPL